MFHFSERMLPEKREPNETLLAGKWKLHEFRQAAKKALQ